MQFMYYADFLQMNGNLLAFSHPMFHNRMNSAMVRTSFEVRTVFC